MPSPAPFLVAHRAGNDIGRLRRAEALSVGLIEADVHLFAGRLEVRHLKTLGPVPILWDRWTSRHRPRRDFGSTSCCAQQPTARS